MFHMFFVSVIWIFSLEPQNQATWVLDEEAWGLRNQDGVYGLEPRTAGTQVHVSKHCTVLLPILKIKQMMYNDPKSSSRN